jgi:hypothetical protein
MKTSLLTQVSRALVFLFTALVGFILAAVLGADPIVGAAVCGGFHLLGYLVPPVAGRAYSMPVPLGRRGMKPSQKLRELGDPSTIPSRTEKRAVYNQLVKAYGEKSKVVLTEGFLRFELPFTNTALFNFPVLLNSGVQRASEQRLAPADAFHIDRIGLFLGARSTAAGGTQTQVALESFGNPNTVFGVANLPAFWSLYNGSLSINVDSIDFVKQLDTLGFRYAGALQTGRVPATGGTDGVSSWDSDAIFRQITPSVRLNGGSSNKVTITLPEPPGTITPPTNTELVVVLICKGWLAQNGAEYNPRGDRY